MKAFRVSIAILGLLFAFLCFGVLVLLFLLPDTAIQANCKAPECEQRDLWLLAGLLVGNVLTGVWHFVVSGLERLGKSNALLLGAALIVIAVTWMELMNTSSDRATHIPWLSWGESFLTCFMQLS